MGNAHPELRRIATHTTASCEEDGFAKAIKNLVLDALIRVDQLKVSCYIFYGN